MKNTLISDWKSYFVDELAFFKNEEPLYKEFFIQKGSDIQTRISFFIDKKEGRTQGAIFLFAPPREAGSVLADADFAEFLESKLPDWKEVRT